MKRFTIVRWLVLVLACFETLPAAAQTPTASVSKVALVSEQDAVVPGKQFWLGLKFDLDPGWHIYWVNAGDSGEPPKVEWQMPKGFRAGDIQWPYPERLKSSSFVDYSYQDHVLLMVPVHAPLDLKVGESVSLEGHLRWVVCREVCIPARQDLTLVLPSAQHETASGSHNLFEVTRKRLPKPMPSNWGATAVSDKDQLELTINAGHRISQSTFFPLLPQQVENAAPQQLSSFPRGVRIRLRKSDQLLKPIVELKGVLVVAPDEAYVIDATVRNAGHLR
ncbi:MAG TPA: protein-disulfide reductase DsbD domain-containing protein [Terriglobales bacterium]|nr:protein-disulfide reductase DsbD domain-containing protein [Terriglobales bacterium]